MNLKWLIVPLALLAMCLPAKAQQPYVPLGYCQMTSLASATLITPANCVRGSFTATGSGTQLTVSALTGQVLPGDLLAGTGVPTGTYIAAQVSGVANAAGVYTTSQATTSSAASLTSGGIPRGATSVLITPEAQAIRFRDDGAVPAAGVGQPIAVAASIQYAGTIAKLRLIEQTSGAKANLSFYR